jgi:glyoxylase-like metal-dependent hydrolase (beta-lactamase superfamily II)
MKKTLTSLIGNSQKLDGGAMFGNVPKTLWSNWITPDENNKIFLACRSLLIEDNQKLILLETGIGAFFDPKLKERYGVVETEHVLLNSLNQQGLSDKDIDFVILSHLHFDHAGGLLSAYQESKTPELLFPNAKYLTSKTAWERASHPHHRDKASFIPEIIELLQLSNRLIVIDSDETNLLGKDYRFFYTDGHTPGMMHTEVKGENASCFFAADLIPGINWVHLPVTMGYDRYPEKLIDEKKTILEHALKNQVKIFYTHDPNIALSDICCNEKRKYIASNTIHELNKFIL